MKKITLCILVMVSLLFSVSELDASCKDASKDAEKIKYEIDKAATLEEFYIKAVIKGITENVYVKVTNENDSMIPDKVFHYSDTDKGTIKFDTDNFLYKNTYIVSIYSEDDTCGTDPLEQFDFVLPSYNSYSSYDGCKEYDYLPACDSFYDTEGFSEEDFNSLFEYQKIVIKPATMSNLILHYIKKYWLFVVIPILIIVLIYTYRIVKLKKGEKK